MCVPNTFTDIDQLYGNLEDDSGSSARELSTPHSCSDHSDRLPNTIVASDVAHLVAALAGRFAGLGVFHDGRG